MPDVYDVRVTVERNVGDFDAGGGTTTALKTIYTGLACRKHFYSKLSQFELEGGANATGPGNVRQDKGFFLFRQRPFPSLLPRDKVIVEATGERFKILHVAPYQLSLEAHYERLVDEDEVPLTP